MEKMLTDEEIVKALEACGGGKGCEVCPYFEKGIDCIRRSEKDTLDLIHRQNAEIERLTEENGYLKLVADTFQADYKKAKADGVMEVIQWIKLNGTLGYGGYVIHDSTIEQMCKKYGVEVE